MRHFTYTHTHAPIHTRRAHPINDVIIKFCFHFVCNVFATWRLRPLRSCTYICVCVHFLHHTTHEHCLHLTAVSITLVARERTSLSATHYSRRSTCRVLHMAYIRNTSVSGGSPPTIHIIIIIITTIV